MIKAKTKIQTEKAGNPNSTTMGEVAYSSLFVAIQPADDTGTFSSAVADAYSIRSGFGDVSYISHVASRAYLQTQNAEISISHVRVPLLLGPSGRVKMSLYTTQGYGAKSDILHAGYFSPMGSGAALCDVNGDFSDAHFVYSPTTPPTKFVVVAGGQVTYIDAPYIYMDVNVFVVGWYAKW